MIDEGMLPMPQTGQVLKSSMFSNKFCWLMSVSSSMQMTVHSGGGAGGAEAEEAAEAEADEGGEASVVFAAA